MIYSLKRLESLAPAEPEPMPAPGPRPRLLIVDDIADNRAVLVRRFERRGYVAVEADCGRRALELVEEGGFDLVLLDVMMPEMDGIDVLRRLRARYSAADLPVIMVTARTQSEDVVAALDLGANDYVTKPVDFPIALARVRTQIERKRAEEQIRRGAEALRLANQELETRVSERTARLQAANRQLQSEIAQREQSEAQAQYLAFHDALTGLGNRLLFRAELDRALGEPAGEERPLAVLFIDLDGFKRVNDTLGHSVGDALLNVVAGRLREALGPGDRIARLGGDEFAVLQAGLRQPQGATALAARLLEAIAAPCAVAGHELTVGASLGIALADRPDHDSETLLKNADLAMYRAKADGRGTFRLFDPAMDASALARRTLEMDLRLAVAQGGLAIHYQPLVDLKTRRVSGFEALMRWNHAQRGFISPGEFIPVAEETGLIVPLGEWALHRACEDALAWPDDVKVAVNLSPVQFVRGNLVPTVVRALARSGLRPSRLELEITESVMLEKSDRNLSTLRQLRELGVRISMDDFGTGYSSLSYLRSFPFDKIKIDQSFIRDLSSDDDSKAIVRAIASLGASFGITTTAEGVETEEQLICLNREGCDEVQGRLFSMPVPAAAVAALLAEIGADAETC